MKNITTFLLTVALATMMLVQTAQAANETKTVGDFCTGYSTLNLALNAIINTWAVIGLKEAGNVKIDGKVNRTWINPAINPASTTNMKTDFCK